MPDGSLVSCPLLLTTQRPVTNRLQYTRAVQEVLSLTYLNKREKDEHTFIFEHNRRLCQYIIYSDLGIFDACKKIEKF